ncbi:MAG: sugar ABC transporter permease [Anaerolineae bacterium]|nr:sugar ABC transporter permease [Anaerolineae bacterium]
MIEAEAQARAGVPTDRARLGQRRARLLRQNVKGYAFISPWIIGLLVFSAYPVLASFYFSFTKYTVLKPPVWIGVANYANMVTQDPVYWKSVSNTLYYGLISVPLGLAFSLFLALVLNQAVVGIGVYRTVYYLPAIMPPVAATLLWMLLLDPGNGLVNSGLRSLGIGRPPGWFSEAAWAKPALIIMSLWGSGGTMLIFLAGLKDIPKTYYEAAEIDGASAWYRLLNITLPLLTPVIFFNLIMGIIGSFGVFTSAYIAGGSSSGGGYGPGGTAGGPLDSMLMYMLLLYRNAFRYFEMGYASAMAVTMFVAILSLTLVLLKTSGRWVYYEAAVPS